MPDNSASRDVEARLSATWLLWLVAVPGLFQVSAMNHQVGLHITAWATVLMGAHLYLEHGGPRVTAPGLYGIATSIFVGGSGLFWYHDDQGRDLPYLTWATWVGFATCALMAIIFWRSWNTSEWNRPAASPLGLRGIVIPVWLLTVAAAAAQPALVHLTVGLGVLVLVAIVSPPSRGMLERATRYLVAALVLLVFLAFVFTGFGRLILVSLALTVVIVASGYLRSRLIKFLSLLALGPVTFMLIVLRESGAGDASAGADGTGSIVNPLYTFRDLAIELDTTGDFGHGDSFLATASFWIPRGWWPAKPVGFGSQLTSMLLPELKDTNHSMAAHAAGEWYYNWGMTGLVAMVLVVGFLVRLLDRGQTKAFHVAAEGSPMGLVWLAAVSVAVAGIPTYMWVGSFTYVSRTAQAVVPLFLIGLVFRLLLARRRRKSLGAATS